METRQAGHTVSGVISLTCLAIITVAVLTTAKKCDHVHTYHQCAVACGSILQRNRCNS